ncbi:putative Ig domain-containing protein [Cohnella caldifontis]|uniref:putative Ig domain-containing protein n=1 Tax=Cohnella caldifontis TaxID=3027471 RepID=UPI0023EC64A0|nr:putative Ig domain-containing protein [Cohnella sp. YIM B05605]
MNRLGRWKPFAAFVTAAFLLFQTFAGTLKVEAAEAAQATPASGIASSAVGTAMFGEVVSVNGSALLLKQEAIQLDSDADEGIQAAEPQSALADYVAVQLTPKTVYQTKKGVSISLGSGLLVAGQLKDGKLVADFVSDMSEAAPIENPVLPNPIPTAEESQTSAVTPEDAPESALSGAEAPASSPLTASDTLKPQTKVLAPAAAATSQTAKYTLSGQSGFPGIHWNWPIIYLVDLGELGKIGVWFEFNAGMGAAWNWPAEANFKLPKLEVGQKSKFTVTMTSQGVGGNENTMYSTFGVGFYVHFIIDVLGKQYNLGVPILNFGFGNSTNKAAPFSGSSFWMDRTTGITIPLSIPKVPLKFKITLNLDYMVGGNDPFIMDSTRPSAAGAVITDRFNYTADRHVVRNSTWDITPSATSGTIQFPEVQYAPSVNYAELQIKVGGSAGMIPVPAFPYPPISIYTNFTLGAKGTPPAVPFSAAPELAMEPYLPGGKVGETYSASLHPSGGYPFTAEQQTANGVGSYKLSIVSGSLPKGLTLDPIKGEIKGTLLAPSGGEEFVIRVTDAENFSKDFVYKIPVMQVNGTGQIGQFAGRPYSYQLPVKGGTAPFNWSLESGTLPPGLSLNANGILSGTPTTAGTYPMKFRVVDSTHEATEGDYDSLTGTADVTAVIAPPSASGQYIWKAEGTISDDPGYGNGMVYNPESGELMRFTGDGKTMLYNGSGWQQATGLSAAPKPRDYASMAYSPKLGGIVLYGGEANDWSGNVSYLVFGDTWLWKDGAWTKLHDGVSWIPNGSGRTISGTDAPPPRKNAALAQDSAGNLILYGGNENMLPAYGDTWMFTGTQWIQQSPTVQPPKTLDPLMVYHKGIGKPVLIARNLTTGKTEVYEWSGTDWLDKTTQVYQAGVGPQDLYLSGAAYHEASRQLVLYGGYEKQLGSYGVGPMKQDFWGLGTLGGTGNGDGVLSSWTRVQAVGQPSFRNPSLTNEFVYPVMMSYDPSRGTLMAFAKEFAGTANLYSLSLSGLVANPPVLPADGVAQTELTFQVTDSGGTPMPGRSVKLTGTGSVSGNLPAQTAVSDSSGIVKFRYQGTQAETLALRIDDAATGETLGGTTVVLTEPVPAAEQSALAFTETEIMGDGVTPATLNVIVKNENGVPLPGYTITATAGNSATAQVTAASPGSDTTDSDGKATLAVKDTTAGTLLIAVSAGKAGSDPAQLGEISLRVLPFNPLAITTASLADGQAGDPYEAVLEAAGGNGSHHWSVIDGELPSGLSLSEDGQITGIPATDSFGSYAFTVRATDDSSPVQSASAELKLKVIPPPLVVQPPEINKNRDDSSDADISMKIGDYGYIRLSAEGGTGSYSWSVVSGTMPKGMTLNASTGIIDGVPTEAGDYHLAVQVKDSADATAQTVVDFPVLPAEAAYVETGSSAAADGAVVVESGDVTANAVGQGQLEVSIFQRNPGGDTIGTFRTANRYFRIQQNGSFSTVAFEVENVTPEAHHLYRWDAASESWSLLPGQTFDSARGITAVTLDAAAIGNLSGGIAFAIGSPIEPPPTLTGIDVDSGPALGGTAVTVSGDRFTADSVVLFGGEPAASTEFVDSGTLRAVSPPGTGVVDVRVQNAYGASELTEAGKFAYVGAPASVRITLELGDEALQESLLGGSPGERLPAYGYVYDETGRPIANAEVELSISQGSVPASVTTDGNGRYTAQVELPKQPSGNAQATLKAVVKGTSAAVQRQILVSAPPEVRTTALPSGQVGQAYREELTSTGSQSGVQWNFSGALPPGLEGNANGIIQGTPTTSGVFFIEAEAVDSNGSQKDRVSLPLVVYQPLAQPLHLMAESPATALPVSVIASVYGMPELTLASVTLNPTGIVNAEISGGQLWITPASAGSTIASVTVTESVYGSSADILLPVTVGSSEMLPPVAKTVQPLILKSGGSSLSMTAEQLATPAYAGHALRIDRAVSNRPGVAAAQVVGNLLIISPIASGDANIAATVTDAVYGTSIQMSIPVRVLAPEEPPRSDPEPVKPSNPSTTAKITLPNGRTVDGDIVETSAGKYELSLPSAASGGEVQLGASLIAKLLGSRQQAQLRIRSEEGWFDLPLGDLKNSLQAYAGNGGYVRAGFRKLTGADGERISARLNRDYGLTPVSSPFDFTLALVDGQDRARTIDSFDRFLTRAIDVDDAAKADRTTVMWLDESAGKWRPVPSRLTKEGGRSVLLFKRKGNSVYAAVASRAEFEDVKQHWSRAAVEEMAAKQIVFGVGAGRFDPEGQVTRAQFAAMLVRALGISEGGSGKPLFTDVEGTQWYASSVEAAAESGLVSGYADRTFRPNQTISRAEMAVMLGHALVYLGEDKGGPSADISAYKDSDSVAGWAKEAFAAMLEKGILKGTTDGQLAPGRTAARAEAAAVLQRLLNLVTFE